jgi:selenocysteine-specific elongation factor
MAAHAGADRRFVIGTAGHIDHGKTALVKALTGVDTDRWEEEKRRGITIDLGFAPLSLGDGLETSVVDVPGHEGFVRNMLAGATGIDVALLVVAADEGVMPQTEEHLAIVELLGVQRGIPVITKADLVDGDWLGLVSGEVATRLAQSRVRWEPPLAVSALTGQGLDALREALRRLAGDIAVRPDADLFRLPIDRVFAVAGAGTVVTGSTWTGSVKVGDSVRLLPLGREARVRSIEVHGHQADRAAPGRRTALALVGVDKQELARGDVAVTGDGWSATSTLDVALELLPSTPRPVQSRSRVRVHLGTAEVLARFAQVRAIAPGSVGVARLVLETPLVARGGDRFVLRSFSPVTTIGGGTVLDPFPSRGPKLPHRRLNLAQTALQRLEEWVTEARLPGLPTGDLPVRLGIMSTEVTPVIAQLGKGILRCGEWLVGRQAVVAEVERWAAAVTAYHQSHPLDPGMSLQALRSGVEGVAPEILDAVIDLGGRKGAFEVAGGFVRRPGWQPAVTGDATTKLMERVDSLQWQVPSVAELEREFPGVQVRALVAHLTRDGRVEAVDQERIGSVAALQKFREALEGVMRELGSATPSALRDKLGLTRKYLIPLLEWADRRGITERRGDVRVPGRLTSQSRGA